MILVERMLNARQLPIGQSVAVQVDGQEILTLSVINVGFTVIGRTVAFFHSFLLNFVDECQVDNDCPLDKACKSQECVDPCLTTICGTRAQCEVDFHTAICVCPPGLQGNPLVACIEAGCSSNSDCATTEKCDFVPGSGFTRKECQPLCQPVNSCVQGAECSARDHREVCTCRYPLIGDGRVSCVERKW